MDVPLQIGDGHAVLDHWSRNPKTSGLDAITLAQKVGEDGVQRGKLAVAIKFDRNRRHRSVVRAKEAEAGISGADVGCEYHRGTASSAIGCKLCQRRLSNAHPLWQTSVGLEDLEAQFATWRSCLAFR